MKALSKQYWNLLITYLKPHWPWAILLAVLILSNIGLQLVSPQIVRYFIDIAGAGSALESLTAAALTFIGAAIASQGLSIAITYLGENVAWKATNALRLDLVLHCLRLDMSFHLPHLKRLIDLGHDYLLPETPVENVIATFDTIREYGGYD